jgi:hypothetical protein
LQLDVSGANLKPYARFVSDGCKHQSKICDAASPSIHYRDYLGLFKIGNCPSPFTIA